jgi:uncharacterized protein (TIGR02217 family)
VTLPIFPTLPGLGYSVTRTPTWRTRIQESISGKEVRVADFSYPRYLYALSFDSGQGGFLRQGTVGGAGYAEQATLLGFFNSLAGSAGVFAFTDPDDAAVTAASFGTGDGITTAFQLMRAYGGFAEPVQTVNGPPSLYVAGALKTLGSDYTLGTTGIVTFASAPASGAALTWTGAYYWAARFNDDTLDFEKFMSALWELKSLKLYSIKF